MEAGSDEAAGACAVVVAGNGSVDDVKRCLTSLGLVDEVVLVAGDPAPAELPGARVIDLGERLGRPAAVNRAVVTLGPEVAFVLVTEVGVTWDDDAVAALRAAARDTPRAGALVPRLEGSSPAPALPGRWVGDALLARLAPDVVTPPADLPGPAVLLRRAALESVGGWDARLAAPFADLDLARRLDEAGWLRVAVPSARAVRDAVPDVPESPAERHAAARRTVGGGPRGIAARALLAARGAGAAGRAGRPAG
ncbi:glycosyltransferase family 2 protein [Pseudonocardia sp. D17]|uniref:glycosyltransferase family 2 protein n=1 Tax=Pseudonocardia sp. D17 TaxID=882661 RepID=UPI002B3EEA07|nr:hypothetical protein PSD17_59700 [Pseudonocardia sp. D17]